MGTVSIQDFTQHGVRGQLLVEVQAQNYTLAEDRNKIAVYDIGDDLCFGAIYPDSARIAVPRHWFPEAGRIELDLKANGLLFVPTIDGKPADDSGTSSSTSPLPTKKKIKIRRGA